MLTKRLADLTSDDILALATNHIAEGRYIEFKSAPVGNSYDDRKEFLADVTAFANASGGDLVFGVSTTDGAASDALGIEVVDPDKEKLRLGDLIRSGAEPRLIFDMVWLPIVEGRGVLVVRVPRSWTAPHRVTLQGHDKFYIRNSAGKHPMNVDELRQAFTLSETIIGRIRAFRSDRIDTILKEESPFQLKAGAKLVFHGVPLSAFVDPPSVALNDYSLTSLFPPFGSSGYSYQHTLEGLATHTPLQADGVRAYTMLFRNCILKSVAELALTPRDGSTLASPFRIEQFIRRSWQSFRDVTNRFGIEPPFYVFISLLNIRGVSPTMPQESLHEESGSTYRRDHLLLSEFEIPSNRTSEQDTVLFKSMFDQISNGFGLPRSLSYRRDGQYLAR